MPPRVCRVDRAVTRAASLRSGADRALLHPHHRVHVNVIRTSDERDRLSRIETYPPPLVSVTSPSGLSVQLLHGEVPVTHAQLAAPLHAGGSALQR